jgi:hypothetical protein
MPKIDVTVIDMAGNSSTLPLPNDKPLQELLPALVTLLSLSPGLSYRLFSPRFQRVLDMNGSLYSNGIHVEDMLRVASIAASSNIELELLDEPAPGTRLPLPHQTEVSIGRGSENDLIIQDDSVSREHGKFIWKDGLHIYHDLNSANGSYINNQVVSEPMPIGPGSILSLGENIRLIYQEAPPQNPDSSGSQQVGNENQPANTVTRLNALPHGIAYVSYHDDDTTLVQRLVRQLREANFHVFWKAEFPPDSNQQEAVRNALDVADALIAVVTPNTLENHRLLNQWNDFFLSRKPMIAVLFRQGDLPTIFEEHTLIEFDGDFNRLGEQLTNTLKLLIR